MIHSIFGKAYVYHNDTMYHVMRIIPESYEPILEDWKNHLDCDTVLKKEGKYFFCQSIKEAEVIEDEQI